MYVNLYPNNELKKTKRALLWCGVLMLGGGLFALAGAVVGNSETQWGWSAAALLVSLTGAFGIAIGTDRLHLKDAFFSMNPDRISYRLTLYGQERVIHWNNIDCIQASEDALLFELKDSSQVMLRLGNINCPATANHVSVSIQLAAIQQHVEVNQVKQHVERVS